MGAQTVCRHQSSSTAPEHQNSRMGALEETRSRALRRGRMEHNFTFDHVFAPEDGQEAVNLDKHLRLRSQGYGA